MVIQQLCGSASASKSITFTPTNAGTYTFTLTGDITDYDTDENIDISKSCVITVKEKEVEQPPESQNPSNPGGESQTPNPEVKNEVIPQDNPQTQEPEQPKQTKSQNNHLSSLVVNDGVIDLQLKQTKTEKDGFNRDVEDYTVIFADSYNFEDLKSLTVKANAEDSKAKISGTGNYTINEGDNTIEVKCTAEDGKVKTYRIKVTKPIVIKKSELKLDKLEISYMNSDGQKIPLILDNLFSSDTFEYTADIDSETKSIFLKLATPKVKEKDIIVKVKGKEISRDLEGNLNEEEINLEDGKNTIRISLISPLDESVQTDYVLTFNKKAETIETSAEVSENKKDSKTINPLIILGVIVGIIVFLLIVLIILLIINHRRNKKAEKNNTKDDEKLFDYEEEDTYLNEENLEKLNETYTNKINEKEDIEELNKLMKQEDDSDKNLNQEEVTENKEITDYELASSKTREEKLAQLEKEIKEKNKRKITKTKEKDDSNKDEKKEDNKDN